MYADPWRVAASRDLAATFLKQISPATRAIAGARAWNSRAGTALRERSKEE